MSERHDDPRAGRSLSTGEFRAAPDVSANTAQFQAFASGQEHDRAWDSGPGGRNGTRIALIIIGIVILAVIIAVVALG